jgi:transcriptional regulator with XRE-family HTH domain
MATQRRLRSKRRFRDLATYINVSGDTQEQIAAKCGTTQAHVSRIAAGDMVPRPALAQKLADYARIPLDSFARVHLAKVAREKRRGDGGPLTEDTTV